jgi:antitoxin Phd
MPKNPRLTPGSARARTRPERISVTATEMKNRFGRMLDEVARGKAVVVTKHDGPRAVLVSIEEYESLVGSSEGDLDALTEEFDALLVSMQTPEAASAMEAAFGASAEELGRGAVAAAAREKSGG